ncbi:MAG: efflux RND transporter periplasmic adaptor subunit [Thermoguttaceae bacterium]
MVLSGLLIAAAAAGCRSKTREVGPTEIPVVPVSHPDERTVTDYVDFTGRTDAVDSVNIVARVTGYLLPPLFQEGSEVKAGQVLFEIDPRPYQAQLDQAKSQVKLNEEQLELAKTTLARYQALDKTTPGAVSQQALDQYKAAVAEAKARVDAQKKSLEVYNLNKEFTQVVSPVDGQVSRYYLTQGNLVNQDQTLLTTVVSLDPMYAYFNMDERTYLRIGAAISAGKTTAPADGDIAVLLGFQNEDGFPHKGTVNFVDNQVNSTTGSITMRAKFANSRLIPAAKDASAAESKASSAEKAAAGGAGTARKDASAAESKASSAEKAAVPGTNTRRWMFSPGMFVRVRLPIDEPHKALLVIDRAIQSEQGHKYVYVLDPQNNRVQTRSVETGPLQQDGLRVVEGEIKLDDLVVVGGIQQVRPKMKVEPDERQMPTLGGPSEAAPPAAGRAKPAPSATGKPKD